MDGIPHFTIARRRAWRQTRTRNVQVDEGHEQGGQERHRRRRRPAVARRFGARIRRVCRSARACRRSRSSAGDDACESAADTLGADSRPQLHELASRQHPHDSHVAAPEHEARLASRQGRPIHPETMQVDGISSPDVRPMSSTELESLKLALLLKHPHLVGGIAVEANRVRALVDEHGEEAVAKVVRIEADRNRETLRNLVAVVEEFAELARLCRGPRIGPCISPGRGHPCASDPLSPHRSESDSRGFDSSISYILTSVHLKILRKEEGSRRTRRNLARGVRPEPQPDSSPSRLTLRPSARSKSSPERATKLSTQLSTRLGSSGVFSQDSRWPR